MKAAYAAGARTSVAETELVCPDGPMCIRATGKMAEQLSALPAGSFIQAEGKIVPYVWTTGEGHERHRMIVEISHIKKMD